MPGPEVSRGGGHVGAGLPGTADGLTRSTANFISTARQLLANGQPAAALEALVGAIRVQGGDMAVLQMLQQARETYWREKGGGAPASGGEDQLASLFAQLALGGMGGSGGLGGGVENGGMEVDEPVEVDLEGSILQEAGRGQVCIDAAADTTSFVCGRCGGVVSAIRREAHEQLWCTG